MSNTPSKDDFKEKLEYALTQAQIYFSFKKHAYVEGVEDQFNNVVEECSKLGLLPTGAYQRLTGLTK